MAFLARRHRSSTRALTAARSTADRSQAEEGRRDFLDRAILQYDDLDCPVNVVTLPGLVVGHGAYEPRKNIFAPGAVSKNSPSLSLKIKLTVPTNGCT